MADDSSSVRSGATGSSGHNSETSSQRSDAKMLEKRKKASDGQDEGDLLEQRRSFQEGVFTCMYTLVRTHSVLSSWKFALLKMVLEGLMAFLVVFNTNQEWKIDTSNPMWQFVRWTLWRSPIARLYGYDMYIRVMYVQVVLVLLSVASLVWLTLAMRKAEQSKTLKRIAALLHFVYELLFMIFYVTLFDYFVFAADCDFSKANAPHAFFSNVYCLSMPHVLHMAVAVFVAVLHLCVTALLVVASSDLNPITRGYLASPDAPTRLRILVCKAIFIIASTCLKSWPKVQTGLMVAAVAFIAWFNFKKMPFYRPYVNAMWTSMWLGVLYTACLLAALTFSKDQSIAKREQMTSYVLYGIFPVIVGGMGFIAAHVWWVMRPAKRFAEVADRTADIRAVRRVHVFSERHEVEVLSRVMRKFNKYEEGVEEEAAGLGETIIKAGMHAFPGTAYLHILFANFMLEVRKDGPAARTHLQLAGKYSPSVVERYQIYCTNEASKKLKDSQDGGMDLQAYIEFRRNFRAVLRVHKEVLALEAELWRLCQRTNLKVADIDDCLDELEAATARAHQVYKRVMERYPNNGKLLRVYGKFLEDVKHDAPAAQRVYAEAARNGGGDAIMSLDLSAIQGSSSKPEFLTSMSIQDDAVIVINAEGTIMMTSQAVQTVFGYTKSELEGVNVALLMPQPFSQRHASYLTRYVTTAEPHILDSVREVVALHKERYVFPISLCVTKMSGTGSDSVFLGVMRLLPPSSLRVRAWVAPNGAFLCGDQQFASMCGLAEKDLVGCTLSSLVANPEEEVNSLLERFRAAPAAELESGNIVVQLQLRHRFQEPVPVEATVELAGTDGQRIMALSCRRTDGQEGNLLVVDTHMRIRFASLGVSALLGYPPRKLAGNGSGGTGAAGCMKLDALLPPPYNTMHAKWLRDPPHTIASTGCRAGKVVTLLNDASVPVPVRIKVSAANPDGAGVNTTLHVIQVDRVSTEEIYDEKRLVLTCDLNGHVQSVSRPDSDLFGFPASLLPGRSLYETVDIFRDWRERNGEAQLGLLMLALLDKEQEMPGSSWRVKVTEPPQEETDGVPHLPAVPSAKPSTAAGGYRTGPRRYMAISACMQAELIEEELQGGGGSHRPSQAGAAARGGDMQHQHSHNQQDEVTVARVKLTLWRRDLLTGVLEMDEGLVVRKASYMTGLIVGMPATAMIKKPIQKFLDMPRNTSWAQIAASHSRHRGHHAAAEANNKRSALKGGAAAAAQRGVVSPLMPFIGPHPDAGTMRILVQGVEQLAPGSGKSKITITMHPDTTFTGAHADLMRVLHLDDVGSHYGGSVKSHGGKSAVGGQREDDEDGEGAGAGLERAGTLLRTGASTVGQEDKAAAEKGKAAGKERFKRKQASGVKGHQQQQEGTEADKATGKEGEVGGAGEQAVRKPAHKGDGAGSADGDGNGHGSDSRDGDSREHLSREDSEDPGEDGDAGSEGGGRGGRRNSTGSVDTMAIEQAKLHKHSSNKSDFVAQWVRTLSKQPSGLAVGGEQAGAEAAARRASSNLEGGGLLAPLPGEEAGAGAGAAAHGRTKSGKALGGLGVIVEEGQSRKAGSEYGGGERGSEDGAASSIYVKKPSALAAGGGGAGAAAGDRPGSGAKDKEGDWEKGSEGGESSADGSQAASGITSVTDGASTVDVTVDARRGRLLKQLRKVLMGPVLMGPLDKLRLHTYLVLGLMLLTHVVCYVVVERTILKEHDGIYLVHRQALAMDRAQLLVVRVLIGTFCERPNITDRVSACTPPLSTHIASMKASIAQQEQYHQGVFMGWKAGEVRMADPDVHEMWSHKHFEYDIFLDTDPPMVITAKAGVWQLGNRFMAACREALYWLPKLRSMFRLTRLYEFIVTNGMGSLFSAYAASLDHLMAAAWGSLDELKMVLIIVLVVEVLVVQVLCLGYEWLLLHRVERARLLGICSMVGLPGPVLRQMVARDVKLLDDSDDEDEDADSENGDHEPANNNNNNNGNGNAEPLALPAPGDATAADGDANGAAKGVQHADSGDAATGGASKGAKFAKGVSGGEDTDGGEDGGNKPPVAGKQLLASATAALGSRGAGGDSSSMTGDESASEDASTHGGHGAVIKRHKRRSMGVTVVNGKTLHPARLRVPKFMGLLVLWFAAVVAVYAVSLVMLQGMQGPLASLNMASHVIYRYTRVRAVGFNFLAQDDKASRDLWREVLRTEVKLFTSEYNTLMYGGTALSQTDSVFQHPVPASTFASKSFADQFFRTQRCFRYNQTLCAKPTSPWYEVTHHGLDTMVRRMITEMELLLSDSDEDVRYNGTRWTYMYNVGTFDLYEGLQQAAELFVSFSVDRYNRVTQIHTWLLVGTVLLFCAFIVLVLWPHLAKLKADAARQSALLSHVPPEVDTAAHVRATVRRAGFNRQPKRARD
ncbi:hypothetical protein HYH02_008120 [Chlamydomonas schloesseri]|uniref:PAS domain-containing protein n=1 Tax=Chlamydomonas schloesseri TaxID=2026947 RepID=A0A835WGG8_9CHLO|nr:hypothetical protein HYH02_008120 [Chlamydomonas schloesseri]|eukprot:KAG2446966.1 hypothetical protein HYH02_008120 [Chlamydomonas schloesseri]